MEINGTFSVPLNFIVFLKTSSIDSLKRVSCKKNVCFERENLVSTSSLINIRLAENANSDVMEIKIGRASCRERVCQYV